MDALEVLKGYLEKTQNFPATEFASLQNEDGSLKDDAPDQLLALHAKGVATQRDAAKKQKDKEKQDEFKRGWKENNDIWDGNLKEIGVDLEGVADGKEKFERLKSHVSTLASKTTELTEDQVKNLPAYRKRETELNQLVSAKEEEWKKKWSERDAKEQRDRTHSVAKAKARTHLLEVLKPVLPADAKKAQTQVDLYLAEMDKNEFDIDGETIIVKDAEGKRIETAHGNGIQFEDWVKQTAEMRWDFQVSDDKSNAGDVTKGTKQGNGAVKKPANRKEYADQLAQLADDFSLKPEEKAAKLQELKKFEAELAG